MAPRRGPEAPAPDANYIVVSGPIVINDRWYAPGELVAINDDDGVASGLLASGVITPATPDNTPADPAPGPETGDKTNTTDTTES